MIYRSTKYTFSLCRLPYGLCIQNKGSSTSSLPKGGGRYRVYVKVGAMKVDPSCQTEDFGPTSHSNNHLVMYCDSQSSILFQKIARNYNSISAVQRI